MTTQSSWYWDRAKAQPGERIPITEGELEDALGVVPPHYEAGFTACGEPVSYDSHGREVWLWVGVSEAGGCWALLGTLEQVKQSKEVTT